MMNSRQIRYAILLSEVKNFSQLADKLNISQPALSKQIQSLENELGVKLFDRNCSPLSLTPAGTYFIQEAREIQYRENQLIHTMDRFKSGTIGCLTIGISPFRSAYFLPPILKKIKDKFPGIQIVLHETNSSELKKEASEGKYDFAIVNLPVDDSVLDIIPIKPETLVLAVPNELTHKISQSSNCVKFSDCKDLPFITVSKTQEMRILFDRLCASSGVHPNICAQVVGITTARALVYAGIGASLLPFEFVKHDYSSNRITLLKLQDNIMLRQPVIITKKGQYISDYTQYAFELILSGK